MVNEKIDTVNFGDSKFLYYVASDGFPIPTTGERIMEKADVLVSMTNWGKESIEKEGYNVDKTIYHGVDIEKYRPVKDEDVKKYTRKKADEFFSALWNKKISFTNKFVVFAIGRNSLRKNLAATVLSFAKFAEGKDDVMLLIHASNYQATDLQLEHFITKVVPLVLGPEHKGLLWNKIVFSPAQSLFMGMPERQVVNMFQMSDLYFSTALGESFGLCIGESMACGIPCLVPDNTTHPELVTKTFEGIGKRGKLIKTFDPVFMHYNVSHKHTNTDDAAKKLEEFYKDWKRGSPEAKRYGENGVKYAKKFLDWNIIVKKWKDLFMRLTQENPSVTNIIKTKYR